MKKVKLAATAAATAALAAILLPAPAASAAEVSCGDSNFVKVTYHLPPSSLPQEACFAGAGWNPFTGRTNYTSWMDRIHTGNNDVAWRDCNGDLVNVSRGRDVVYSTARCLRDVGIYPL
jgi:hypothetical protein